MVRERDESRNWLVLGSLVSGQGHFGGRVLVRVVWLHFVCSHPNFPHILIESTYDICSPCGACFLYEIDSYPSLGLVKDAPSIFSKFEK